MPQATALKPGQIRHLLRVTAATSRHPERDCLLLLGITAGMRITEIAQIEVQDVLLPSGALRGEVSLRAAITKGCRQRCIYVTHPKAIGAMERYLTHRVRQRLRMSAEPGRYRGLHPSSKLILTHKGYKFQLNTKRRTSFTGERIDYLACDSLQARQQAVPRRRDQRRLNPIAVGEQWLRASWRRGQSIETVQLLLGHAELDHVRPYLQVSHKRLEAMFASVL